MWMEHLSAQLAQLSVAASGVPAAAAAASVAPSAPAAAAGASVPPHAIVAASGGAAAAAAASRAAGAVLLDVECALPLCVVKRTGTRARTCTHMHTHAWPTWCGGVASGQISASARASCRAPSSTTSCCCSVCARARPLCFRSWPCAHTHALRWRAHLWRSSSRSPTRSSCTAGRSTATSTRLPPLTSAWCGVRTRACTHARVRTACDVPTRAPL